MTEQKDNVQNQEQEIIYAPEDVEANKANSLSLNKYER